MGFIEAIPTTKKFLVKKNRQNFFSTCLAATFCWLPWRQRCWPQPLCGESASAAQRSEKRVLDCTLDSKTIDDCDPVAYGIRVAVFSAPGLIIAVFFLLCCPFYCMAKYCCNCCGGRNQSPNFCCPNKEIPARYSKGDLIRPRVFATLCLLTACGAFIWGYVGGAKLTGGLMDFGDSIKNVPGIVQGIIDDIDTDLTVEKYDATTEVVVQDRLLNSTDAGQQLYSAATKIRDDMDGMIGDKIGTYQDYLKKYSFVVYLIFAIPFAWILLGSSGCLCSVRKYLPMCMVWLIFLFGFILWILHVVFCATSMAVGDTCAEVHGLANKQLNLVATFVDCKDSMFSDFKTNFKTLELDQSRSACRNLKSKCLWATRTITQNLDASTIYHCPDDTTFNCDTMTFALLMQILETDYYIDPAIASTPRAIAEGAACTSSAYGCTPEKCSRECTINNGATLSTVGKNSKSNWYDFLTARAVSNAVDTLGAKFATCDSLLSIVASPFSTPCTKVTDGLVFCRQSTGLLGLCCIASIFILAWGAKRWISISEAGKPQRDGPTEEMAEKEKEKDDENVIES